LPASPEEPDLEFRLAAHVRQSIAPWFDVNAIEKLLQCFPPEARESVLEQFLVRPPLRTADDGRLGDVSVLSRISHPRLEDLLEDVWQPFWSGMPDRALDDESSPYPGRARDRRRRAG
jgi:hypothetical protein